MRHRPTRMCPHRWCRGAHAAVYVVGVMLLAEGFTPSLAVLAYMALTGVIGLGIFALVNHRSVVAVALDDAAPAGTVFTLNTGWARAAVAVDLLILVWVLAVVAALSLSPADESTTIPPPTVAGFASLVLGFGTVVLETYAHRRSIRSAEPVVSLQK